MINSVSGSLPRHLYVWVDSEFTHKEPIGLIPAVWFGLVSIPGRMWGCTVMLESGAIYRNLPPMAIWFSPKKISDPLNLELHPTMCQRWDCYGSDWSCCEYPYLSGLSCVCHMGSGDRQAYAVGEYLFSVTPIGDGFSAEPEQAKEFSFIMLGSGHLTIMPTDRVIFEEKSFTKVKKGAEMFPTGLKRQENIWSCE